MTPKIIKNDKYVEVIGHYDNDVLCAKMTLLADLYAIEHKEGYAKFPIDCEDKLKAIDEKLEFPLDRAYQNWYLDGVFKSITYNDPAPTESIMIAGTVVSVINSVETVASYDYGVTIASATLELISGASVPGCNNVYAISAPTGYTITYETNGGSAAPQATGQTALPNPLLTTTKAGNTFAGWYTDSAFTTLAVAGASISQNTTLYAKWIVQSSIDVSTLTGWGSLASGNYNITLKAKASGYRDSEFSSAVSVTKAATVYTITPTLTNVTADSSNPTTILSGGSATLLYYNNTNYTLPNSVSVTGATGSWNVVTQYEVTATATNATVSSASTFIDATTGTGTIVVSADGTSYKLPTAITVAGISVSAGSSTEISGKCTVLYTRTSDTVGTVAFSAVVSDTAVSVVGESAGNVVNINFTNESGMSYITGFDIYEFIGEVKEQYWNYNDSDFGNTLKSLTSSEMATTPKNISLTCSTTKIAIVVSGTMPWVIGGNESVSGGVSISQSIFGIGGIPIKSKDAWAIVILNIDSSGSYSNSGTVWDA